MITVVNTECSCKFFMLNLVLALCNLFIFEKSCEIANKCTLFPKFWHNAVQTMHLVYILLIVIFSNLHSSLLNICVYIVAKLGQHLHPTLFWFSTKSHHTLVIDALSLSVVFENSNQ